MHLAAVDIRARLGSNIRRLRTERRLSQEALAELANLHRTYVSDIERGARNPTIAVIQRLGDALGVDPADLIASNI